MNEADVILRTLTASGFICFETIKKPIEFVIIDEAC